MLGALVCQVVLLVYHQVTTVVDLFPFNGARNSTRTERWTEAGVNGVLMSLAPIGFALQIRGLMVYGVWYYFVLLALELLIWWLPYVLEPAGRWRHAYNLALALATSNFEKGDTLNHWYQAHRRIHTGTLSVLPWREGRIRPNLEHLILHALTLITALATLNAVRA